MKPVEMPFPQRQHSFSDSNGCLSTTNNIFNIEFDYCCCDERCESVETVPKPCKFGWIDLGSFCAAIVKSSDSRSISTTVDGNQLISCTTIHR